MTNSRLWAATALALALCCSVSTPVRAQFNQPPTADAGPDQIVDPLSLVTLDGSQSHDPEFQPLTYLWIELYGASVTLSDPLIAMPTFTAPAAAQDLLFQLTACDTFNFCTSDSVMVTVSSVPLPAAAWLFGSGLLGLLGVANKRTSSQKSGKT